MHSDIINHRLLRIGQQCRQPLITRIGIGNQRIERANDRNRIVTDFIEPRQYNMRIDPAFTAGGASRCTCGHRADSIKAFQLGRVRDLVPRKQCIDLRLELHGHGNRRCWRCYGRGYGIIILVRAPLKRRKLPVYTAA